ncbi:hypothetical protein RYX41_17150 [Lactiplantibacillus plantarum]|nr:hypothetical protein [Lactiplantibacillus plantarum]MDV2577628.1 hypothetical protein [Lactiplantibacillus plantarum]
MNAKKIATLGAALFIGIGLAGCGNNSNKSSSNSKEVSGPLKKLEPTQRIVKLEKSHY